MDDDRLTSIGLASKGYGNGDPDAVSEMPVETVLDLLAFVNFENQYVNTRTEINREETRP